MTLLQAIAKLDKNKDFKFRMPKYHKDTVIKLEDGHLKWNPGGSEEFERYPLEWHTIDKDLYVEA